MKPYIKKNPRFEAYSGDHCIIVDSLKYQAFNHPDASQRFYARSLLSEKYYIPNGMEPITIDWYGIKLALKHSRKLGGNAYESLVHCIHMKLRTIKNDRERNPNAVLRITPSLHPRESLREIGWSFHDSYDTPTNFYGGIVYHKSCNEWCSHS